MFCAAQLQRSSASCLWALLLQRPTCYGRVHREGQSSHYSYNEIIMNGVQRPHHKNIYCIIYSVSPLVQGERTHINLQPCFSPPHSSCCLLLKAEAHSGSVSSFHSVFFFVLSLYLFLLQEPHREHLQGPRGFFFSTHLTRRIQAKYKQKNYLLLHLSYGQ